jgi:hypothetical protein
VADVGEKLRFGPVDFRECLGALPLDFERPLILFGADAFGNIHSRRDDNDNAARIIFDRHAGEVDDVLRTIAPEVQRLAAERLT